LTQRLGNNNPSGCLGLFLTPGVNVISSAGMHEEEVMTHAHVIAPPHTETE